MNNILFFFKKSISLIFLLFSRKKNFIQVLTYHRVLPDGQYEHYFRKSMALKESAFCDQINYISKHYKIISIEESLALLEGCNKIDDRYIVVTFDDGYIDNYLYAFPILKKYNVPATIFLTTDPVEYGYSLWWDKVWLAVSSITDFLSYDDISKMLGVKELDGYHTESDFVNSIVDQVNTMNKEQRQQFLQALYSVCRDYTIETNLMMSWQMVEEMSREGVSFQCHTKTHAFIDELSLSELDEELLASSDAIEQHTGFPVRYVAYPKGRTMSFEQTAFIKKHFNAAFSTEPGHLQASSGSYDLMRKDARYLINTEKFDSAYLEAALAGFWASIRRLMNR